RSERIDIALIELTEAPARRTIGTPDRLNLIALEETRYLRLMMRDNARQRHGQVVAQCEVGLPARLVLAALQDLENELIAFLAILAEQCLEIFDSRRLQGLEPVALVHTSDHPDDEFASADVVGQKVAHPPRRLSSAHLDPFAIENSYVRRFVN